MRSFNLDATPDTIRSTFIEDAIGRNNDLFYFLKLLSSIEGCYSLALDSKWGAGKTFFVRQALMILEAYNPYINIEYVQNNNEQIKSVFSKLTKDEPFEIKPVVPIYYDAWENDNEDDPIASIAYNILQQVDTDYKIKAKRNYVKVATKVIDFFTGRNLSDVIKALHGDDPLAAVQNRTPIQETLRRFIDQTLIERGERLIVFIDELDRCKPSYAVRLLERIKHYFVDERITFVFSVNIEQLQHTVCRYYGERFNACGYLDRFFDLRISLPKISIDKFVESFNVLSSMNTSEEVFQAVIRYFDFELREISRYLHTCKVAIKNLLDRRYTLSTVFCLQSIVPIMIGLKLYNQVEYTAFVNGTNSTPLVEILTNAYQDFPPSFILGHNESFDKSEASPGILITTVDQKLKDLYTALFIHDYTISPVRNIIGRMEIDSKTQQIVLKAANVLTSQIYTGS